MARGTWHMVQQVARFTQEVGEGGAAFTMVEVLRDRLHENGVLEHLLSRAAPLASNRDFARFLVLTRFKGQHHTMLG